MWRRRCRWAEASRAPACIESRGHAYANHEGIVTTAETDLPPCDPKRILAAAPFPERLRLVCRTWASQVAPNPRSGLALYGAEYLRIAVVAS